MLLLQLFNKQLSNYLIYAFGGSVRNDCDVLQLLNELRRYLARAVSKAGLTHCTSLM